MSRRIQRKTPSQKSANGDRTSSRQMLHPKLKCRRSLFTFKTAQSANSSINSSSIRRNRREKQEAQKNKVNQRRGALIGQLFSFFQLLPHSNSILWLNLISLHKTSA